MGSRVEGILKNISTVTNAAGDPPHCPDGVWFETGSTQAAILAETSVTGGQLKMSNGGKIYLSDANDGKYHDISVRSYGHLVGDSSSSQAANSFFNLIDRIDSEGGVNRYVFDAPNSALYIPPVWGPVLFSVAYTFPAGSSVTSTELRITDTSGTTGATYEYGEAGSSGVFSFEANLFPEFKENGVTEVSMLKRGIVLDMKYQGTKGTGGIDYTISWFSMPGGLLSDG